MKKVCLLFFLSISLNLFSQKENVLINLPETSLLFVGYDNLVEVSFIQKKIKNLKLVCDSCETIKLLNESQWVIRVNSARSINLKAINKKGKVFGEVNLKVLKTPQPTLRINGKDALSLIDSSKLKLDLVYEAYVPLKITFLITKWHAKIGDKEFSGIGNKISQDLENYLIKEKKGTIVFEINYKSVSGDEKLKEIFEFNIK